jgi:hypothetical protein
MTSSQKIPHEVVRISADSPCRDSSAGDSPPSHVSEAETYIGLHVSFPFCKPILTKLGMCRRILERNSPLFSAKFHKNPVKETDKRGEAERFFFFFFFSNFIVANALENHSMKRRCNGIAQCLYSVGTRFESQSDDWNLEVIYVCSKSHQLPQE